MDVSSLVKAVQELYDFIWPSVLCLLLTFGVFAYIARVWVRDLRSRIASARPDPNTQIAAFKLMKRLSFDKLIPVLSAFLLVFVLDAVRNTAVSVGNFLPPNISFQNDNLLRDYLSSPQIATIYNCAGGAGSIMEFDNAIDRVVSDAKDQHKSSPVLQWTDSYNHRVGTAEQCFSACKFFLALCLLAAWLEVRRTRTWRKPLLRCAAAASVLLLACTGFVFREVWYWQQQFYARNAAAVAFVQHSPGTCDPTSRGMPSYADFRVREGSDSSHLQRWWSLRAGDPYYFHWMGAQVKGPAL